MILKRRNFGREEIFREKKFDVGEEEVWWRRRRTLVEKIEKYWWKRKGNWDMEKFFGGEEEIWWRREGDKVWSLLLAHFQPFFSS